MENRLKQVLTPPFLTPDPKSNMQIISKHAEDAVEEEMDFPYSLQISPDTNLGTQR